MKFFSYLSKQQQYEHDTGEPLVFRGEILVVLQHKRLSELINVWQSKKVFGTARISNLQGETYVSVEIIGLGATLKALSYQDFI